jgi:hypothetical protein
MTRVQIPAADAARCASSTPSTTEAVALVSPAPLYAYSTLTFASATSRSAGASEPGALGTLGHLMVMLAQNAGGVHVVVDHDPHLPRRLERHRDDVDAFVGEQLTDSGQGAGRVREAQGELGSNHAAQGIKDRVRD